MESEFQRLSEEVRSYAAMLRQIDGHTPDDEDDSPPHVEKIDFDHLYQVLIRVCEELNSAQALAHDVSMIRQWLTGRIQSLERGRRAIINEAHIGANASSLSSASMNELICRFEDVSASVRSITNGRACRRRRPNAEYQEFKS